MVQKNQRPTFFTFTYFWVRNFGLEILLLGVKSHMQVKVSTYTEYFARHTRTMCLFSRSDMLCQCPSF